MGDTARLVPSGGLDLEGAWLLVMQFTDDWKRGGPPEAGASSVLTCPYPPRNPRVNRTMTAMPYLTRTNQERKPGRNRCVATA
jgi:hypothetical protein